MSTITSLTTSVVDDLKLAASKMLGVNRRSFLAEMTLKYCQGKARLAEYVFGWGRETIKVGLEEKRSGLICFGAQSAQSGNKRWESRHPDVAQVLFVLAKDHAQQDPTFKTSISYTRLTAALALKELSAQGFSKEQLPSPASMAQILNRNGYRLRKVLKAKPLKKIPQTDAIFDNVKAKDEQSQDGKTKHLSIDCKATVKIGDYSRGGETRGENKAGDHDMGCKEKYTPFGILDEDEGKLHINFGSSFKTSDFIVDSLESWWKVLPEEQRSDTSLIQIKVDNGPESSGVRTQFLDRMCKFSNEIGKAIQLLYYPPYHSKYNPIERCWGILEQHWNGAILIDAGTMLAWAQSMTWKGLAPVITLSKTVYEKGITLSKKAMNEVEKQLTRDPLLPKWDILITPKVVVNSFL